MLDQYMCEKQFWSVHQAGFRKGHRTEDNLFILNTIFQSDVVLKKKKVHCAFVDFRKFFDRINRDYLMYKLLKNNITGPFYHVLKYMYSSTHYRIKNIPGCKQII